MSDTKKEKKEKTKEAPKADKSTKSETKSGSDTSAKSSESFPSKKSASQSSISHFSSVSTNEYRSGWESIFGGKKTSKKKATSVSVDLPLSLEILDDDIKGDLRTLLYKAFQQKARKEGVSFAQLKKIADIGFSLNCEIVEKTS